MISRSTISHISNPIQAKMFLQLLLFGVLVFLIFKLNQRDKQLPPGEWGLPVVGVLPYFGGNLRRYFKKVKGKYGNIFCMRLGSRTAVFLRDFETIKTHLNKPELAYRPDLYTFSVINLFQKLGIIFINGPVWEANRRFALRHLRDFGLGKSSKMQEIILREAHAIVKNLEANLGQPIEVENNLYIAVVNVVWGLVAGKRLDPNNPRMVKFSKRIIEDSRKIDGRIAFLNFFPFFIPILPSYVKNNWLRVGIIRKNREESHQFLKETIEDHRKTLDRSNPRDYIDAYLIEMEEKKETTITFSDPIANLVSNVHDFFNAGMNTVSTTMKWFILYMAAFPHVQEKIQEELDSVLPRGQLPLLEDKDKLPYLQAAVNELMRHRPLTPFSIIRSNAEDYQIDGYKIPKGSLIFPCIEECHYDPKYWENPEEYYPERFLDENGNFKMRTESFLPFSYGKRLCLGESVAKMELFMYAGAITQSYKISLPEDAEANLEPDDSVVIVSYPHPFKVILEKRI